ncbi:MAG: GNAT family N-acetyltransferase [Cyanophyceae cyanobacterium]
MIKFLLFFAPDRSAPSITSSPIVRQAQVSDLKRLAEVLVESFHPSPEYLWWMTPLLKLGIYEDLRQRLCSHAPHYACLVASVLAKSSASHAEQIVGTIEIASRSTDWSVSTQSSAGTSSGGCFERAQSSSAELSVPDVSCSPSARKLSAPAPQTLYISNLAVKASWRRQGIAQSLLARCEQLAQQWGFCRLSLHVLEDNYQARQLYAKRGYQLERIESSLGSWLFKQPRRLLLSKQMPLE